MSQIFEQTEIKKQLGGLCAVEVSGESCANCFSLAPLLRELVEERGDIRFVHVEAEQKTVALMDEWQVEKVPAILLMDDGEIFARCYGFQPREILELWLDAKIEEHKRANFSK